MSRFLKGLAFSVLITLPAHAGQFGLGREATPAEIAAWDIDVRPDGTGLPEGRGTVAEGEEIFAERCAVCHGDFGEGVGRWPVLAGGQDTLKADRPVKTIGSYWPYLSTVWDYVNRAMPFGDAQSLSDDEVYAITAYLLYLNDVIDDEAFELSRDNFTDVRLPNEENFFADPRPDFAVLVDGAPCMENCKATVEITAHAAVLNVTPDEEAAGGGNQSDAGEPLVNTEVAVAEPEPAAPELIAAGETLFKKCKACHQVGGGAKHRVGPQLNSLLGRAAASAEGYKYSKALKASGAEGLTWTAETLAGFLEAPKKYIPKTKMSFKGLESEGDRTAIIAYLSQFHE
jgi:cytochrome c